MIGRYLFTFLITLRQYAIFSVVGAALLCTWRCDTVQFATLLHQGATAKRCAWVCHAWSSAISAQTGRAWTENSWSVAQTWWTRGKLTNLWVTNFSHSSVSTLFYDALTRSKFQRLKKWGYEEITLPIFYIVKYQIKRTYLGGVKRVLVQNDDCSWQWNNLIMEHFIIF